jgi:DNA-binding NarL/FixJ family response regulator
MPQVLRAAGPLSEKGKPAACSPSKPMRRLRDGELPREEKNRRMNRIILADNQTIFRTGAARVLALEDDMRIVAQCDDTARLWVSIESLRGSVALVASSLKPDVPALIAKARHSGSRVILIAESTEQPTEEVVQMLDGMLHRNAGGPDLIDSVRRVARGERYFQRSNVTPIHKSDSVGARVRDRLTPREMQIVALIVQGCKNKDIALQLGTKEQVIKNYLRGIYDKTGVSDRLELALFTIHHRVLAEAAAKAGDLIEMKSA